MIILDHSTFSEKVIHYGYHIARQLNASVDLLLMDDSLEEPIDTLVPYDALYAEDIEGLERFLHEMKDKYSEGIETGIHVLQGNIREGVLLMAERCQSELIISGTHARTGLERFFSGSVSEDILRHASVPMLIVPVEHMKTKI